MTDRKVILNNLDLTGTSYSPTGGSINFSGDDATILELYSREHDHTITVYKDDYGYYRVYDDQSSVDNAPKLVEQEIRNRMQS